MKRIMFMCMGLWALSGSLVAQVGLDFEIGTSKSDAVLGQANLFVQPNQAWRFGATLGVGSLQYRFVDARAVNHGSVWLAGLFGSGRLAENDRLRLDAYAKVSYRRIQPDLTDPGDIQNYSFSNSDGLVIDPGLLATIKLNESFRLFTGINLHSVYQLTPELINEQGISGYLLAGGSVKLSPRSILFIRATTGPTFGAGGDTEKYFWQLHAGIRFTFGEHGAAAQVLGY